MKRKQSLSVVALAMALLAAAPRAHASTWPDACGKDEVQFKVKTSKNTTAPAPEAGKAQVIFLLALDGEFAAAPTTRFGVDGNWVGADRGVSYFAVSLAPGTHHFCASRQSSVRAEKENVGIATLNVEAGKTYFYEFKIIRTEVGDASMKGGAMLPGQYPGSMTAKPKDTVDNAVMTQLGDEDGRNRLKSSPASTSSVK